MTEEVLDNLSFFTGAVCGAALMFFVLMIVSELIKYVTKYNA